MTGNLYFRKDGNDRLIKETVSENDIMKHIRLFLAERNYKSYYTRVWRHTDDDGSFEQIYDVGSWSEFFVWKVGENDDNI